MHFRISKTADMGVKGSSNIEYHQDSVSVSRLLFFPILAFVLVIYCCVTGCTKCRDFKLHTLMISLCLWVRRLGTADLGLWLQAFSTGKFCPHGDRVGQQLLSHIIPRREIPEIELLTVFCRVQCTLFCPKL